LIKRVFLDTGALFAAILAPESGARVLLRMGEAGLISLWIGRTTLREADWTLRRKAPETRLDLARLLEAADAQIAPQPDVAALARAAPLQADARTRYILAEALAAEADYFVTLTPQRYRQGPDESTLPLRLGTPTEFLQALRAELGQGELLRSE
jgi:predicted nucleic acid-binding protein